MFSEVVDAVIARSGRPDRALDIIAYVNASIRDSAVRVLFNRDLVEDSIVVTDSPCIWQRPQRLRQVRTARIRGRDYLPEVKPGRKQTDYDQYYYAAANYFAFNGVAVGDIIDIAYYVYPAEFSYYAEGNRPAVFDKMRRMWTYLIDGEYADHIYHEVPNPDYDPLDPHSPPTITEVDELAEEAFRDVVTHWLLDDWAVLVIEGALTKIFTAVGDERNKSVFSIFKAFELDLLRGEAHETMNV